MTRLLSLVPDRLVRGGAPPGSRVLQQLDALDLALYRQAATARTPRLDRVLPRLTRSADHGLLWLGVAVALAASGGERRTAAVRGLSSLAVASATANIPAKLSARRARPELHPVPGIRHLRRQPTSSSFPSGHSASAAAFATGVAFDQPLLGLPVGLLAAGVAYGRVHTGVHYPGDVLAGVALGVGGAYAVRRAWPVRPRRPAVTPPAVVRAPALPGGAGLTVVVNTRAGGGERVGRLTRELEDLLPEARIVPVEGRDVAAALREAARSAVVLGVAGGDGTVNTAAGVALETGLPLAVVPGGTLNHFAAELGVHGVPELAAAVQAGSAVDVTVGSATKHGDGLLAVLTGRLGRSRVHEQRIVAKLPVRSRQGGLRIARDGEVSDGPGHLLLRAASHTLVVYRPAPP